MAGALGTAKLYAIEYFLASLPSAGMSRTFTGMSFTKATISEALLAVAAFVFSVLHIERARLILLAFSLSALIVSKYSSASPLFFGPTKTDIGSSEIHSGGVSDVSLPLFPPKNLVGKAAFFSS